MLSDGPGDESVADYGLEVETGPHVAESPEQYAAAANALTLVGYMWDALKIDDDQMIVEVLLPETLARLGHNELRPAARLREAVGVTRETCALMGCALTRSRARRRLVSRSLFRDEPWVRRHSGRHQRTDDSAMAMALFCNLLNRTVLLTGSSARCAA